MSLFDKFLFGLFLAVAASLVQGTAVMTTTMPTEMEVLADSCALIPCRFAVVFSPQPVFSPESTHGVWIIDDTHFGNHPENVIYNSSQTGNTYSMRVVGNLTEGNCTSFLFNTTRNYTHNYYFRIVTTGFKATGVVNYTRVVVTDSPPRPSISSSGDVEEGVSVSLRCSAVAPCPLSPPVLTWNSPTQGNTEETLQENPDQTKSVLSTVTFTPSEQHHERNITCTALYKTEKGERKTEHTLTLNVLFSPKDTSASVHPADLVSVGSNVTLTCSSKANPPVSKFCWFRVSGDGPVFVAEGENITLRVTDTVEERYYCMSLNDRGHQNSSVVQLRIKGREADIPYLEVIGGSVVMVLLVVILLVVFRCWRISRGSDARGAETTDTRSGQTLSSGSKEGPSPAANGANKRAETSSGQSKNSSGQSKTSSGQSQTSSGQSKSSSGQPQTSSGQSKTSSGQSKTSSGQPQTSSGQSKTSSGQSKTSSGQSETSSGQPKTSSGQPQTSSGQSKTSSVQPQTMSGQSKTSSVQPQTMSSQPKTSSGQSQTSSVQPQTMSSQPKTSSGQPEEIHYGEIDFSKLKPKPNPALGAFPREETEYSEVRLDGARTPPPNDTEGLYAEVKQKETL